MWKGNSTDQESGITRTVSRSRSYNMSRIKGINTKPELLVRKLVTELGFKYRLHVRDLPGKPDLAFKKRKKVIYVNGCFWHRHKNCKFSTFPKTNVAFWMKKFNENIKRDEKIQKSVLEMGWKFLVLWECEIGDSEGSKKKLLEFLE